MLRLHFEPRLIDLHIEKVAVDAASMAVVVKTHERQRKICEVIVRRITTKVEPAVSR
jgi:type I restriction enzyme R subunit